MAAAAGCRRGQGRAGRRRGGLERLGGGAVIVVQGPPSGSTERTDLRGPGVARGRVLGVVTEGGGGGRERERERERERGERERERERKTPARTAWSSRCAPVSSRSDRPLHTTARRQPAAGAAGHAGGVLVALESPRDPRTGSRRAEAWNRRGNSRVLIYFTPCRTRFSNLHHVIARARRRLDERSPVECGPRFSQRGRRLIIVRCRGRSRRAAG